jgi:hypothetical protein
LLKVYTAMVSQLLQPHLSSQEWVHSSWNGLRASYFVLRNLNSGGVRRPPKSLLFVTDDTFNQVYLLIYTRTSQPFPKLLASIKVNAFVTKLSTFN